MGHVVVLICTHMHANKANNFVVMCQTLNIHDIISKYIFIFYNCASN